MVGNQRIKELESIPIWNSRDTRRKKKNFRCWPARASCSVFWANGSVCCIASHIYMYSESAQLFIKRLDTWKHVHGKLACPFRLCFLFQLSQSFCALIISLVHLEYHGLFMNAFRFHGNFLNAPYFTSGGIGFRYFYVHVLHRCRQSSHTVSKSDFQRPLMWHSSM